MALAITALTYLFSNASHWYYLITFSVCMYIL